MKLILGARFILILLLILSLDAVQYDAPALSTVESNPKAYADQYLKFQNWLKLSDGQREKLIAEYMHFLRTDGQDQIPASYRWRAKRILRETSPDELVPYVNKVYMLSKKALRANGSSVDTIVFQYVRNRLETEKNYHTLLLAARHVSDEKNPKKASAQSKYDLSEYLDKYNNVFETPYVWFWYDWWECQNQNEKKALVSGYMVSLNEEIKRDWCYNAEERRRYDLLCKLVSVDDLVNHVDRLYENPLYRDDHAGYMIYEYMIDNFQIFIGAPIALQG